MSIPDYYEILQVSPRADQEVIKAAYGRLAIKHHPDRNPNEFQAERRMKLLNAAKETLLDPERRKKYDARLAAERREDEIRAERAEAENRHNQEEEELNRRREDHKRRRKQAEEQARKRAEAEIADEIPEPSDSAEVFGEVSTAWNRGVVWLTLGVFVAITGTAFLTTVIVSRAPSRILPEQRTDVSQETPLETFKVQPDSIKSKEIAIEGSELPENMDLTKAVAHVTRAISFQNNSDFDNAIADYTMAIRYNPKLGAAYAGRGFCQFAKGESCYGLALADINEAVRLDVKGDAMLQMRGAIYTKQGNNDKAIADLDAVIELHPRNGPMYNLRGIARHHNGEYQHAIDDYSMAIQLNQSNADACRNKAWIQSTCPDERLRDGQSALVLATKACELSKWANGLYLDTRAAAYAELGDFSAAVEMERKAIITENLGVNKREYQIRLKLFEKSIPYRKSYTK